MNIFVDFKEQSREDDDKGDSMKRRKQAQSHSREDLDQAWWHKFWFWQRALCALVVWTCWWLSLRLATSH